MLTADPRVAGSRRAPTRQAEPYLELEVAGQLYGLPLTHVQEVVPMAQLSGPPDLPALLAGFLNLAGTATPVLRLDRLFRLPEQPPGLYTPLVILRGLDSPLALLAERVHRIRLLAPDEHVPLPEQHAFNDCALGMVTSGERMLLLLAPDRLLLEKEQQLLAEWQDRAQTRLAQLAEAPAVNALCRDPAYPRLKEHLIGVTGLAYYADKDDDLAARVAQRLAARRLTECAAYLALLEQTGEGEVELNALVETLTIGETFFFRHAEFFEALRNVAIPDLIERNRASRRLHIWSAGCSIGAETYSIAILLRRDFAHELAGWDVQIVGTDINRRFLARAREGCFEEWALRNSSDEFRQAHFTPAGCGWRIADAYRAGVAFQYHNLVTQAFPSLWNNLCSFDLILCRNVTIYFRPEIVRHVLGELHASLVDGGWLAVGHAEPNTEAFAAFRTVNADGAVLYQKAVRTALSVPERPVWTPPTLPALPLPPMQVAMPPSKPATPVNELAIIRGLANRGDWAAAERHCHAAQARHRLEPALHFYHALVLEQTGRHPEAEQALRQALYLDRRWVLAHYYLGLLQQQQGQFGAAARSFTNVRRLLARLDPAHVFAEGDGITAAELDRLTRMHLDSLEAA